MILLDEIDVKEKEKRESLPPYSPRRSLGRQVTATDLENQVPSPRFLQHTQTFLHPRSASLSVPSSRSQYTLVSQGAYSDSTQTLVPQVPTTELSIPSPSTSQLDIPKYAITLAPLSLHHTGPPPHLRAANNVYVQREAASITGAFAIDPALIVPDCLLPDDPDVLLVDGMPSAKGKGKRANLCLVTRSGDICVDVWVRKGCASRKKTGKRHEDEFGNHRRSSQGSEGDEDYWADGWTSPPSSKPFPLKTSFRTDIDIRSESGSITLRLHAQSHQRLRIHLSSAHGSVSVGVPRTFVGYVHANILSRSDSADSHMRSMSSSTIHLPAGGSSDGWDTEKGGGSSIDGQPAITPRQPVQFTEEMESIVTPEVKRRKAAMGRYFVGKKSQIFAEHMGSPKFDELRIESRRGTIGVSFNDESPQQKQGLITKLLNKAW